MRRLSAEILERHVDWPGLMGAIEAGHRRPRAEIGDTMLYSKGRKYLVRSAWITGLGACTKAVTVYPENPASTPTRPSVQGQVILFDEETGAPSALLDGPAETRLKTAADSGLGSRLLSRKDSACLLMVGAGNMATPLIQAHIAARPSLQTVLIWNRTQDKAKMLADRLDIELPVRCRAVSDLSSSVAQADIVSAATMADTPLIKGQWLRPGQHVDLVGAYTPHMREADDAALARARIFVDSFDTTLDHIGELAIPLNQGTLTREAILGDFYDLIDKDPSSGSSSDLTQPRKPSDITLFKNGGGAHLDLMVSAHLAARDTA